jgi:hypothetical protein
MGCPDLESFRRHRRVLTEKLTQYMATPRVWSKYAWCVNYHNAFLALRADFPDERPIDIDALAGKLRAYP